jgi:hypothetical protein
VLEGNGWHGGDSWIAARRLLTLSPDHEPVWVRLYVHQIGETWAAMILADHVSPPHLRELEELAFFAAPPRGGWAGGDEVAGRLGAAALREARWRGNGASGKAGVRGAAPIGIAGTQCASSNGR